MSWQDTPLVTAAKYGFVREDGVLQEGDISRLDLRQSILQTPLRIHEKRYPHGLGTYATSALISDSFAYKRKRTVDGISSRPLFRSWGTLPTDSAE